MTPTDALSSKEQQMNSLDLASAHTWIDRFATRVREQSGALSELDRLAGDGDFGSNIRSALERTTASLRDSRAESVTDVFAAVSDAFLNTGGTSGPLLGVWFRQIAAAARAELTVPRLAGAVTEATGAVRRLGGADVGHKTMVDAMVPAAEALTARAGDGADLPTALHAAARAASDGAESTRALVAKRGRASYVGDRSRGVVDPGATAIAYFFQAGVAA